eukprot:g9484.t1
MRMKKDLEDKVAVTLARFDKAVKESSTRRRSDPTAQQQGQGPGREVDLVDVDRIAAEAEGGAPVADNDKPRCRPWDYEGFIARQKTFTPLKWFAKPASTSPPVCARYGWINTARNTLSCECCGAQLRFSDGDHADSGSTSSSTGSSGEGGDASAGADAGGAAQPSSATSFSSRLKSQHHDLCPWKGNPCPKEFLQLPPMAPEDLLSEFVARLRSLEAFVTAAALPEVSLPSSFEEHCPGGLLALAAKTRTVLAQHASPSPSSCSSSSLSAAAAVEAPGGSENAGTRSGGNKRQRDAGDAGAAGGGLSGLKDEVLGTAAAIALFGWGSANAAGAAPAASTASSCTVVAGGAGGDSGGDGGARSPKKVPFRLRCVLCNRRLTTDNFLTIDIGPRLDADAGMAASQGAAATASDGDRGSGRSGKRRRLSGGGTPLKQMDLATEHRSFCPWAAVHTPEEGEEAAESEGEGALPGWRQPLEALLNYADSAENEHEQQQGSPTSKPKEPEGFGDMASGGKAEEALPKVQKVLGVLMRF